MQFSDRKCREIKTGPWVWKPVQRQKMPEEMEPEMIFINPLTFLVRG